MVFVLINLRSRRLGKSNIGVSLQKVAHNRKEGEEVGRIGREGRGPFLVG